MQRAVEFLPPDVAAYFATELREALLLALNVWHLPFQAFLLRDVLPLLLQRCPSRKCICCCLVAPPAPHRCPRRCAVDWGGVAEQLLTEVFRLFVFYTRRAAPDLSLASAAQVTHFVTQVVAVDSWQRGLVARYPEAAGRWTVAMRRQATQLLAQHAAGDATVDEDEVDSCRFLLQCLQTLCPEEPQSAA